MHNYRANLYYALAEALSEPPVWLTQPGSKWPVYDAALMLAKGSKATRCAVEPLANIPSESSATRRERYRKLFAGAGSPQFWLYESLHLGDNLLGHISFSIEKIYQTSGLHVAGAERPDHASVELAFLGYLADQQAKYPEQESGWRQLERQFIKKHAGRWLPKLGWDLYSCGDGVYAPIGKLLAEWLEETVRPRSRSSITKIRLPFLSQPENCTLCGFCTQACPTKALTIFETASDTHLLLNETTCIGCGKCEPVCFPSALRMDQTRHGLTANESLAGKKVLYKSSRNVCPSCGQPTTSKAELDFVKLP
jgi:ferredoxin